MVEASSQWQQWVNSIRQGTLPSTVPPIVQPLRRLKNSRQFTLSLALLVLLLWNWKLVLASGVGLFAAIAAYLIQQGEWRFFGLNWDKLWHHVNRQLTLAVASGGIAALSTYVAIAVWAETDTPWLAAATVLQGLGILSILLLTVWQKLDQPAEAEPDDLYHILPALTDPDPLKRLIASRQITDRLIAEQASLLAFQTNARSRQRHSALEQQYIDHQRMRSHVIDCFRLMLDRETEPTLCNALLDGLNRLSPNRRMGRGQQPPLSIAAASVKQPEIKIRRQAIRDDSHLLHPATPQNRDRK